MQRPLTRKSKLPPPNGGDVLNAFCISVLIFIHAVVREQMEINEMENVQMTAGIEEPVCVP